MRGRGEPAAVCRQERGGGVSTNSVGCGSASDPQPQSCEEDASAFAQAPRSAALCCGSSSRIRRRPATKPEDKGTRKTQGHVDPTDQLRRPRPADAAASRGPTHPADAAASRGPTEPAVHGPRRGSGLVRFVLPLEEGRPQNAMPPSSTVPGVVAPSPRAKGVCDAIEGHVTRGPVSFQAGSSQHPKFFKCLLGRGTLGGTVR